jgi:pimeloyl-ACP methyl ester carboxylesterase
VSTVLLAGIGRVLVAVSDGMAAASLAVLVCLGAVHAASASGLAGPDPGSCDAMAKLDDTANGVIRATRSDDDSSIRPFVFISFMCVRNIRMPSPVIITHGWPGSIIEQLKVIDPLTNPVAHGGKASDAFDVVIPSLPGYGFSGAPTVLGWDPVRIARAWIVLMQRLGYTRYVAQGGDWVTR